MDIDFGRGEHCVCKTAATKPSSSLPEWIKTIEDKAPFVDFREGPILIQALAIAWDCLENIEVVTTGRDTYSWVHARVVGELKRIRELGETK